MRIILSDFMTWTASCRRPAAPRRTPTARSRTAAGRCRTSTSRRWAGHRRRHGVDGGAAVRPAHLAGDAAAWPGRAGDPFADRMNEIPTFVASRTLTQDDLSWSGLDAAACRRRDWGGARAACTRRQGPADLGQRRAGPAAGRARSRRRVPTDDRARRARRRHARVSGDGRARPLELVPVTTAATGLLLYTYQSKRP